MTWESFGNGFLPWASLLGMVGVLNWVFGGAFPLGRRLILRRSWLFVTMRWGGLLLWIWTFTAINILDRELTLPEVLNLTGAVLLLMGTARKRVKKPTIETSSTVKSLFGNSS